MRPTDWLTIATLMLTALVMGCQTPQASTTSESQPRCTNTLARLVECMAGTFSSSAQSQSDPDNYFEIRLVVTPIWIDRSDAHWLYIEQAAAESLDRPYRQRVYRITQQPDGTFQSDIYTLPGNPFTYAGAWRGPGPLMNMSPTDLELPERCSIVLELVGPDELIGSTIGDGCVSTLRGASYATSEVRITPNTQESWDRGFDVAGNQVWGAVPGPYIFQRCEE